MKHFEQFRTYLRERFYFAHSLCGEINNRKSRMQGYVVKAISDIPNELKGPHATMVKVCSEFENNINSYISGIDKGNATEFYTTLTVLASALKVCTKMEQVVVKAVASMIKIVK